MRWLIVFQLIVTIAGLVIAVYDFGLIFGAH